MADYRTVKVSMWAQDEWFMDQDTEGKLPDVPVHQLAYVGCWYLQVAHAYHHF